MARYNKISYQALGIYIILFLKKMKCIMACFILLRTRLILMVLIKDVCSTIYLNSHGGGLKQYINFCIADLKSILETRRLATANRYRPSNWA